MIVPLVVVALLAGGVWMLGRPKPVSSATPEQVAAEILPEAGDPTTYGIPLALENTQRFIDHYDKAALTPDQQAIVDEALGGLKAPCCDDNTMATCCCSCNLAKAVWGLSGYLVVEHGYDAEQVRDSASQWLHLVHGDYYVREELKERGIDPGNFGVSKGDACYVGNCELAFTDGGCGGMDLLVQ